MYADSLGKPFRLAAAEVRSWGHVSCWPPAERVTCPPLLTAIRYLVDRCQMCGDQRRLDVHHIIGGTKGRSDELTNLILICRSCHQSIHSGHLTLSHVLWHQWAHNRDHLVWTRLACLRRQRLPTPEPDWNRHYRWEVSRTRYEVPGGG